MQIKSDILSSGSKTFQHSPSPIAEKLLYYPLSCGHYYYPKGYRFINLPQDCIMILYTINGNITTETNTIKKTASTKESFIFNLNKPTTFSCAQDSESIWSYFKGANSFQLYEEIIERNGNLFPPNNSIMIYQQLLTLFQTISHPERATDTLLATQIYRLLCEFMNPILPASSDNLNYEKLIQETKKYITLHLTETLTVKKLATRIHLSPSYFSKIFKQQTGFSPYDYVLSARLDCAKNLLKNTDDSIIYIAEKTGFNSESNFIYCFTSNIGISPNKYRKLQ